MELQLILSFLVASLLLTLMPGPDNIFVLTESISNGKRNGIAISSGLASGIIIHTIIIATGLSIVIQKSEIIFFGIKLSGILYLFYLVYLAYKESPSEIITKKNVNNDRYANFFSLYKKGFLMNILNPKVTLFFIAFLPQFVSKDGLPTQLQFIVLGTIFMIQAFLVFSIISTVAEKVGWLLKSERTQKNMKWCKISVLIGITGLLIFS